MTTIESSDRLTFLPWASHQLRDGVRCLPGGVERVRWRSEVVWYLGLAPRWAPMLVVARENGERLQVHPADCTTAEGES
ncbi:hypothetical protein [Rubrimonas cliftonensis]|uniref:Uncharacterized protein n=1 Tax=Rubrimonas cliftonensis TaxID=89524 RepID=A0A1H4FY50_9RHOB|nr:hypothetical protein [Rubrimonas cliftonensis]SEB02061.1 hypothetical protein SAMN05444370_1313 [Rubrimonas cliftonensis]